MDGAPCSLGARAFDVLLLLIERRAGVVSRKEVLGMVWAGLVVEHNNLTVQVSALRKLLGAHAIATVPNRGYQFTLPVEEVEIEVPLPSSPRRDAVADAEYTDATVLLLAHGAGPPTGAQRAWLTEAGQLGVPSFGGRLVHSAGQSMVAGFSSASAAAACARHLSGGAEFPDAMHLALCGAHELEGAPPIDSSGAPAAALRALIEHAGDDAVVLSPHVTGRLVNTLDGDFEAVGPPPARGREGEVRPTTIAYRVAATPREAHAGMSPVPAPATALPAAIAVLPFRSYTGQSMGIGIGDVISDQLITQLAHGGGLNVTSRLSTAAFRERPCSLDDVALHLGAAYVVSGRYLENDGQLSIDVEVADTARRTVLWKHLATESASAILQSDSLLLQDIVGGIARSVFAAEIEREPTAGMPTLATHTLLLTAIGLLYRLAPSDFFKSKLALDALRDRLPTHPAPLAWLSRWHLFKVVQGWSASRDEDGRQADDLARRALDIAPDSALALTMLGNARTSYHKDPAGAEALYDRALAINPSESLAWLQKGNALSFRGEGRRAMEHIERAISLSPLDPSRHFYQSLYASASLTAGDYVRAITAARSSLRMNREHVSTYRVMAIALSLLGRMEEAQRAVSTLQRLEPGLTVKAFIARSPGAQSGLAQRFGDALHAAGLPLGQ